MAELFTLEYCKTITEKARGMSDPVKGDLIPCTCKSIALDAPLHRYELHDKGCEVAKALCPADIPRLSDPFRDPKLSWMRTRNE